MRFIAVDIGCLECGEASALLGVYETAEEAQAVCDQWDELGWRGGQHSYEVFNVTDAVGLPNQPEPA